jgi:lipopolysaccharide/colanic/teichoic acid biosynthesis glycosyltransferase
VVSILRQSRSRTIQRLLKRGVDIVGSAIAIILLAPLFCIFALLIKLTSKGPVLLKQRRFGQFGKPFQILKFRSMYMNSDLELRQAMTKQPASGEPLYNMRRDPRVTRFGRFLRRTSLDELPQFLNVLRGDMSLVGPRPLLGADGHGADVLNGPRAEVKPGIIGLWQVNGRASSSYDDMIRLDVDYSRRWSIWLDLKLLLKTPWAVLTGGDTNSVSRPPGWLVSRCAAWLLSPRTVQHIVNPILSDLQMNYFEALAERRPVKATWVRLRGYWDLFKALGLAGVLKMILQVWKSVR